MCAPTKQISLSGFFYSLLHIRQPYWQCSHKQTRFPLSDCLSLCCMSHMLHTYMIDLSVGVELTLEALSLLPLVSLSLRSAVASLLASLFATWPRCCLDDPDGAVPRQSARLARVLLTATACRRLRARERFRRDRNSGLSQTMKPLRYFMIWHPLNNLPLSCQASMNHSCLKILYMWRTRAVVRKILGAL